MVSQLLGGANFYQQHNSRSTLLPLIAQFDGVDPLLIGKRCPHSGCALLSKKGPSQLWGKTDNICVLQPKPGGPSEPFINGLGFCLDFSGQDNNGTTPCRHHRISCLPTNFSLLKTRIKCHSSLKEGPTCSCWCQYCNLLPAWPLLPCQVTGSPELSPSEPVLSLRAQVAMDGICSHQQWQSLAFMWVSPPPPSPPGEGVTLIWPPLYQAESWLQSFCRLWSGKGQNDYSCGFPNLCTQGSRSQVILCLKKNRWLGWKSRKQIASIDTSFPALALGWLSLLCFQMMRNYCPSQWVLKSWFVFQDPSLPPRWGETRGFRLCLRGVQAICWKLNVSLKFSSLLAVFKVRLAEDVSQNSQGSVPVISVQRALYRLQNTIRLGPCSNEWVFVLDL